MLKRVTGTFVGLAGVSMLLSGCTVDVYSPPPREHVYVEEAPPPDDAYVVVGDPPPAPVEVVGVAPGPGYVWMGGEYVIVSGRYQWRGGHWDHAPRGEHRWVPGHIEHRGRTSVHVEGHWE